MSAADASPAGWRLEEHRARKALTQAWTALGQDEPLSEAMRLARVAEHHLSMVALFGDGELPAQQVQAELTATIARLWREIDAVADGEKGANRGREDRTEQGGAGRGGV